MVDILDHLQHLYVPMAEKKLASGKTEKVQVETVFFGGDLYSPRNDPDPEMIPNPEMIPKLTPK